MWGINKNGENLPTSITTSLPAEFREIDRGSVKEIAGAMGKGCTDQPNQRFAEGRRCFGFWREGEIASYCWVSHGIEWIGEMQVHFKMREGEAYIWDCATLPVFRRKGLYAALLYRMVLNLFEEGIHRIWIGSNLENIPSIKGFQQAGFHPIMQVLFVRIWILRFFRIKLDPSAPEDFLNATRRAFSPERAVTIYL
jgi:ribosomal protein S18 acetylase RimI-like enzyme